MIEADGMVKNVWMKGEEKDLQELNFRPGLRGQGWGDNAD